MSDLKARPSLDSFSLVENGHHYWKASWFAKILGYKSLKTFTPVINKAVNTCIQLGIPFEKNFISDLSNNTIDFKLTKFACFLIVMQADGRKPIVKRARTFFLNELEEINLLLKSQDYLARMNAREELKTLNVRLAKAAKKAHVKDFSFFMNEGYLGMYNKTPNEIKRQRGIPKKGDISDFMSLTELSANIFRITLTTERLSQLRNPTEKQAAKEHWKIGSQIRSMVMANIGSYPEFLPISINLDLLQKKLKNAQHKLNDTVAEVVNKIEKLD